MELGELSTLALHVTFLFEIGYVDHKHGEVGWIKRSQFAKCDALINGIN